MKWLIAFLVCCPVPLWSQSPSISGPKKNLQLTFEHLDLRVRPGLGVASQTDTQIRSLQEHIKKAPNDYAGYNGLGAAYVQKARETGEIDYYDLAEQSLKKCLELVPQDFRSAEPLVHMSLVFMGEHRFTEALAAAQKAISLGSGNLAAFAIEGDAYTDMGDYDEALTAYRTAQTLGAATSSPLGVAYMQNSRMAYLAFLHGDTAKSIELMKGAITAALQGNVPRENLAWLYFELGERCQARGEFEFVGQKPLGDGFVSVPVKELRGAVVRRFLNQRIEASMNLLIASGYTGQTTETLALPGDPNPFERIVGVRIPSSISGSVSYRF